MAAVAPIGAYRKGSFKIYVVVCLIFSAWFAYDGYLSPSFAEKHSPGGQLDSTMKFNRTSPYVLIPLALLIAIRWYMVKDEKIVADGKTLILANGEKIDYDKIEKIDKTNFEKKGYFRITYKDGAGKERQRKLSDRNYDNLQDVLAELVAAMKG
jgi:hypothetical protein